MRAYKNKKYKINGSHIIIFGVVTPRLGRIARVGRERKNFTLYVRDENPIYIYTRSILKLSVYEIVPYIYIYIDCVVRQFVTVFFVVVRRESLGRQLAALYIT